jgi:hypothetical protein
MRGAVMALCEAGFRYDSEVPKNGPGFGEFGEEIHELDCEEYTHAFPILE